jgi:hypothetical protein
MMAAKPIDKVLVALVAPGTPRVMGQPENAQLAVIEIADAYQVLILG